jgi:hypothetical protein
VQGRIDAAEQNCAQVAVFAAQRAKRFFVTGLQCARQGRSRFEGNIRKHSAAACLVEGERKFVLGRRGWHRPKQSNADVRIRNKGIQVEFGFRVSEQ